MVDERRAVVMPRVLVYALAADPVDMTFVAAVVSMAVAFRKALDAVARGPPQADGGDKAQQTGGSTPMPPAADDGVRSASPSSELRNDTGSTNQRPEVPPFVIGRSGEVSPSVGPRRSMRQLMRQTAIASRDSCTRRSCSAVAGVAEQSTAAGAAQRAAAGIPLATAHIVPSAVAPLAASTSANGLLNLPPALLTAIAMRTPLKARAPLATASRALRAAALATLPRLCCVPAGRLAALTRVNAPVFQGLTDLVIDLRVSGGPPAEPQLAALLHAASARLPPRGVRRLTLLRAARGVAAAAAPLVRGLPGLHALEVVGRAGGGLPGLAPLLAQPPPALASLTLRRCRLGGGNGRGGALAAMLPLSGTLTELRLHSVFLDPWGLSGLSDTLTALRRLSLVAPRQSRLQLQPLSALTQLEELELSAVRTRPVAAGGPAAGDSSDEDEEGPAAGEGGGGLEWEDEAWETDSEGAWDGGLGGGFGGGGGGVAADFEEDVAVALGALRGLRRLRVQRLSGAGDALMSALGELSALSSLDIDILLSDPRPPLCWSSWALTLRELKVESFCFTRPWPGPPLAALTCLEVSHGFSAPEAFLDSFAPALEVLSAGCISWSSAVEPGRVPANSNGGAAAAAAATAATVHCSLGAVPWDCRIRSLTIGAVRPKVPELAFAAAPPPAEQPAAAPPAAASDPPPAAQPEAAAWWGGRAALPPPPPPPPLQPLTLPSLALQADTSALLLRLTQCTALSVAGVESRAFVRSLPGAIAFWTSLQDLRLESLPQRFDDAALRCALAPHASTLTSLAVINCRGITWRGIEALGTLTRLRRLCVEQQTEVTTASVIAAARAAGVTELRIAQLSACATHSTVDEWQDHATAAFEHAAHWATATALRVGSGGRAAASGDSGGARGDASSAAGAAAGGSEGSGCCDGRETAGANGGGGSGGGGGAIAHLPPPPPPGAGERPGVCESWEFWLGAGDAEAVARALPQLNVLVVEP